MLAICGQAEATVRGASYQQELNLDRDVRGCRRVCAGGQRPAQLRHVIDRAMRLAIARRGPSVLICPRMFRRSHSEAPSAHMVHALGARLFAADDRARRSRSAESCGYAQCRREGRDPDRRGRGGCSRRGHRGRRELGAGVAKALLGKSVLPDDLPFVTGAIGLLGTKPSSDIMNGCDTLLMVGTGFPWSEFLPKDGAARAVQIDIDPAMLSLRYPAR